MKTPLKNSSRFLINIILLIIILFTLVRVGLFFNAYKPSSVSTLEPISNWKTYTNSTYGYSFKYPENIFYVIFPDPYAYTLSSKEDVRDNKGNPLVSKLVLEIDLGPISGNKELDCDSNSQCFEKLSRGQVSMGTVETRILDSNKKGIAYSVSARNLGFGYSQYVQRYIFKMNKNVWRFGFVINDFNNDKDQKYIEVFDQILATFKFLE